MEYNGVNPSQIQEGRDMARWNTWYNSNDPEAVKRREKDKEFENKLKERDEREAKEFQEFLRDNQVLLDAIRASLEGEVMRIAKQYYENNKLKRQIRSHIKRMNETTSR